MRRITRSYRIRTYPNGAQRRLRDRWFGAYRWLWNTTLEIRTAACPKCNACHDRDINAARNLLMEGLRQLAARGERDLCLDAGDACPEEILVQVLAEGDEVQVTRSGHYNRACQERVGLH